MELLSDLISGFQTVLRADSSWLGDLSEDERELCIEFAGRFLELRRQRADFDFGEEQTRLRMTLRLFSRMGVHG